jgi:hypothetical protein
MQLPNILTISFFYFITIVLQYLLSDERSSYYVEMKNSHASERSSRMASL